ncbi:hypothetical protein LAZ67_10004141 [Cordylochernes scorpioides]|uniref:Histone-lysine N-methyltransferase SETMAR n=1 Tax=Cordylochernes scorpioides TaxID=51811 RepID=A0ABY6KXI6_9ARAC|nr:hypothetical protein LAZ67_10004141 [Cordylochernes scorpioides]
MEARLKDCTTLEQRAVIRFLNAEGIQTSQICQRMKNIYGFEVLEHPAYTPDLAPSDYFLFGLLKKELKGKLFDSDEDVQKVVQDFFHTLPKSAYKEEELSSVTGLSVYLGIMRCLREAVRLKRPERWQNNDWILHVGNARPHTVHVVLQFLAKHSTIQIPHPPYSPDLAPNYLFLYPKLKMNLKGRKFDHVDLIQAESKATLRNLSKSDFISCFDYWKKKMERVY